MTLLEQVAEAREQIGYILEWNTRTDMIGYRRMQGVYLRLHGWFSPERSTE